MMEHIGTYLQNLKFPFLFYVLQGVKALFSGSYLYYIFHIINKNLAVSNMAGIKNLLCRFNHLTNRNRTDYDLHLYLREQAGFYLYSTVILRFPFLCAAA